MKRLVYLVFMVCLAGIVFSGCHGYRHWGGGGGGHHSHGGGGHNSHHGGHH